MELFSDLNQQDFLVLLHQVELKKLEALLKQCVLAEVTNCTFYDPVFL